MENKLENVWNRKEEADVSYRNPDTFELKEGYDFEKMKSICEEEGISIEDFMEYAQERAAKEEKN